MINLITYVDSRMNDEFILSTITFLCVCLNYYGIYIFFFLMFVYYLS